MKSVLLSVVLAFAPAAASAAVVQFGTPAGTLPAGHLRANPFDAVLPSGRLVTPLGTSVVTGVNALGMTLTPDGRYAVVSNDDPGAAIVPSGSNPQIFSGPALTVVDTATLAVTSRYAVPDRALLAGIVAVADPREPGRTLVFAAAGPAKTVAVFDLDESGRLVPDDRPAIALGAGADAPVLGDATAPVMLAAGRSGAPVYAVDAADGTVAAIDPAARALAGPVGAVGFFPFGAAVADTTLLVTNEGLMRSQAVAAAGAPPFGVPPPDPLRASSLSLLPMTADGTLATAPGNPPPAVPMDLAPDGVRIVGGAHPTAIAVTPDARYAFVAMTNVDRIATVALGAAPHVAGGTELRLFDRGPYGTQPTALAVSSDGTRLYAALAGLDAVAVLDARDPLHLHRLGLIPTGWLPTALALSRDDRTLYVLNTKGAGRDRAADGVAATSPVWSTLQKIDLGTVRLNATTYTALKNTRRARPAPAPAYPRALRNVVVIVEENKTFDAVLGDLGYGPADPSLVRYGADVTPNLHALARRYAVAGNLFADADHCAAAHQYAAGGIETPFAQRTLSLGALPPGGAALVPEDYPRAGYIFDDLARHAVSFRDYGDWLGVAGYDDGAAPDPRADDPAAGDDDRRTPTHGLGGLFASDVPAPATLAGHVDLDYPGWNMRIRDERRAREFIRDYSRLVARHRQPRYTQIWLPADHTASGPGLPPPREQVADGDRALGTIVQYFSHLRSWRETAIFVMADAAHGAGDHIGGDRTYAVVISPFAKHHYVGMRHLSTVSVLKTSEQILHVPPLSLGDLLASDMSDFFTLVPDARPFASIAVPVQTAVAAPAAARASTGTSGRTPNPTILDPVAARSTNGTRDAQAR